MDVPFPKQFDTPTRALATIDYPTLMAMLVAHSVVARHQPRAARQPWLRVGNLADRMAFFSGASESAALARGPFLPKTAIKDKTPVNLGASIYGRMHGAMKVSTAGADRPARSGEKQ